MKVVSRITILTISAILFVVTSCSSQKPPESTDSETASSDYESSVISEGTYDNEFSEVYDESSYSYESEIISETEQTETQTTFPKTDPSPTSIPSVTKSPAATPTVTPTPTRKYNLMKSDYIPDVDAWTTPYLRPEKGFEFEVEITSLGTSYNRNIVEKSIIGLELGTFQPMRSQSSVYEWGYSFTHLSGVPDGSGHVIEGGYPTPPKTRQEALDVIEQFLLDAYLDGGTKPRPWSSKNGHYMWHHYAGEFGFDILSSEIGENINSYQMHIAFNRGAAKQYNTPWAIDFSAWHGPSITDYSSGKIWGDYSGPDHGHSMNLLRRTYYTSYMSGAPYIIAEAGGAISFYDEIDENGFYKLSPYGETGKEFYDFTKENPDLGTAYVPFGIVLDYYHGVYPGFGQRLAFHHFPYNAGDNMTWNVMNLFFPGGWEVMGKQEVGTLVNGPYGDICDVILQNAPQKLLNSYPVLILSGDIKLSEGEIQRYKNYVRQGGILVLNSAYLDFFPEYKKDFAGKGRYNLTDGKGKVIAYSIDYSLLNLRPIIEELAEELIPFQLSENIHHVISIKDGRIFIALINNEGVTKEYRKPPVFDQSKTKTFNITYTGLLNIIEIRNLHSNVKYTPNRDNTLRLTLKPGELMVLEYVFD